MLKPTIFPSLLLVWMLTACGGGGSSNPTSPVSAPLQPATVQTLSSVPQVIEIYGDSTIWGWETNTTGEIPVAIPAPTAFAQALPTSPLQTVRNKGVSGQTACQLLNADWAGAMATSNATVVIVNHGINDSRADSGEDITNYKSCLTQIARTATLAGKRVIFETPNPVDNVTIGGYVIAMREVAAQERLDVIDQYDELMRYMSVNKVDLVSVCPDGLHPTQDIYIRKGQYAARVYVTLPL